MASRVDLSQGDPTVHHHAKGFLTHSIVWPYYSLLYDLNIIMLTIMCIVTIVTVQSFVITLILSR